MKKKLFTLLVAAVLSGTGVCMAQSHPKSTVSTVVELVEQIVSDLGLSNKQAKKFKAAMEDMHPDKETSEKLSREELEKKKTKADAKIKKILTDDQYQQYQQKYKDVQINNAPNNNNNNKNNNAQKDNRGGDKQQQNSQNGDRNRRN